MEPHTELVPGYDGCRGRAIFPCEHEQFIADGIVHGGRYNNTVPREAAIIFKRRKRHFYMQTSMLIFLTDLEKRTEAE